MNVILLVMLIKRQSFVFLIIIYRANPTKKSKA